MKNVVKKWLRSGGDLISNWNIWNSWLKLKNDIEWWIYSFCLLQKKSSIESEYSIASVSDDRRKVHFQAVETEGAEAGCVCGEERREALLTASKVEGSVNPMKVFFNFRHHTNWQLCQLIKNKRQSSYASWDYWEVDSQREWLFKSCLFLCMVPFAKKKKKQAPIKSFFNDGQKGTLAYKNMPHSCIKNTGENSRENNFLLGKSKLRIHCSV